MSSVDSSRLRKQLAQRSIKRVVVLGANGTMGMSSGALFTQAVPNVSFLARTKEKAQEGLAAAIAQVRSPTVASRVEIGDYASDFESAVASADLIFEALAEDFEIKTPMFERIEKLRRDDAIVATVTSGLSINRLAETRNESFRAHFAGLHFFNPPNIITGTELIAGNNTKPEVIDFLEAFSTVRLGRDVIRAADTPGFAGNRIGFKVLNDAAQLVPELGAARVDQLLGPYTGRALTPLSTIDLVGWDVHKAIVNNVYANCSDEAHASFEMPDYMSALMQRGIGGNKTGGGFFKRDGNTRMVLDAASGNYRPEAEVALSNPEFIGKVSALHAEGRYREAMQGLLEAPGQDAQIVRTWLAGYLSYALHRVGEVAKQLSDIDLILASGFNWAPPSVLIDMIGVANTVKLIEQAELPVPEALTQPSQARFFSHPTINPGRFFVAR